jgi:cysteine desulfurase
MVTVTERIYLDHAANAPMAESVIDLMQTCMRRHPGNPSQAHAVQAKALIETAREHIATLLGAQGATLVFTSGATEADNAAIVGGVRLRPEANEIVSAQTEHAAVLETIHRLVHERGFKVRWCQPNADGVVEPDAVQAVLSERTALVSLMLVNNETGVVQDVASIANLCRAHAVPMHVDAAQAPGRVPIAFDAWGIDAMSVSAHKQHGPVGVGALVLKDPLMWTPWMMGGGQQRGLRSGTLPLASIVGMGEAYRLAAEDEATRPDHYRALTQRLWNQLAPLGAVRCNGAGAQRSGHILSVSFDGVDGDALHALLGRALWISRGSACHSESGEPSKVLRSLGLSDPTMAATVRLSVGRDTTSEQIDAAAEAIKEAYRHCVRLAGL